MIKEKLPIFAAESQSLKIGAQKIKKLFLVKITQHPKLNLLHLLKFISGKITGLIIET